MTEPAVRDRLREALDVAVRDGDRIAAGAYRAALNALEQAEAADGAATSVPDSRDSTGGTDAGGVPPRLLTAAEQRAVLAEEIGGLRRGADDFAGAGQPADALRLWAQADLLAAVLAG